MTTTKRIQLLIDMHDSAYRHTGYGATSELVKNILDVLMSELKPWTKWSNDTVGLVDKIEEIRKGLK